MEGLTKLRKVGGSLVATIPKGLIELEGLTSGQAIKITVEKIKKSGFGSLKGLKPLTKEDKEWLKGKHD